MDVYVFGEINECVCRMRVIFRLTRGMDQALKPMERKRYYDIMLKIFGNWLDSSEYTGCLERPKNGH